MKVMTALRYEMRTLTKVACSDSPWEDEGILKMVKCEMLIKKLLSLG
jgi:hypothetical protein